MITEGRRLTNRESQRRWRERQRTQVVRVSREKMDELAAKSQRVADLAAELSMWQQGIDNRDPIDLTLRLLDVYIQQLEGQARELCVELEAEHASDV